MTASEVASTTTSFIETMSTCQGSSCPDAAYMWFALVMASCCPFVAFCCCCICNKWYLDSGPYAGLTDADICPSGKRCSRPCMLFCLWCCPSCFTPPSSTDDDNAAVTSDVSTATTADVTRAPPPYEEALTMARPSHGDSVIFVCDETVCSFKFSKEEDCDPPAYKFLEGVEGSGSGTTDCEIHVG